MPTLYANIKIPLQKRSFKYDYIIHIYCYIFYTVSKSVYSIYLFQIIFIIQDTSGILNHFINNYFTSYYHLQKIPRQKSAYLRYSSSRVISIVKYPNWCYYKTIFIKLITQIHYYHKNWSVLSVSSQVENEKK